MQAEEGTGVAREGWLGCCGHKGHSEGFTPGKVPKQMLEQGSGQMRDAGRHSRWMMNCRLEGI
jgi:hypothetical protein